jgi:ribulose-phosphate 3-epimerase
MMPMPPATRPAPTPTPPRLAPLDDLREALFVVDDRVEVELVGQLLVVVEVAVEGDEFEHLALRQVFEYQYEFDRKRSNSPGSYQRSAASNQKRFVFALVRTSTGLPSGTIVGAVATHADEHATTTRAATDLLSTNSPENRDVHRRNLPQPRQTLPLRPNVPHVSQGLSFGASSSIQHLMTSSTLIAPSILSADFGRLAAEIADVDAGGADWIHVDVMDGRYVPNITIGPFVVAAARKITRSPLDVHLMVVEPERWVDPFIDAGADGITVHQEACTHLQRTLMAIKGRGKRAGVSLNPATSEETLRYVAGDVDLVLVMSVNPGFGGQRFLASQLEKVRRIRQLLNDAGNHSALIEIDGGITTDNAAEVCAAGCDVLVAGSSVFGQPDRKAAIAALRAAGQQGVARRG